MDNLPIELLFNILYYLDDKDYLRFSFISKKFREVVINDNKKGIIKINHNFNKFKLPINKFNVKLYDIEINNYENYRKRFDSHGL